MENPDFYGRNRRQNDGLGVNKIGRNIRKSPPHQTIVSSNPKQHQQTRVYNINKTDFRSVVQQLTGPSSHNALEPPTTSSLRLQKIRPPPLAPFNQNNPNISNSNSPLFSKFSPPLSTAESPISAYMRYLQTSVIGSSPEDHLQLQAQFHGQSQPTPPCGAATTESPSPSSFLNLLSPRSPFPLLSPAFQLPSPSFIFSPLSQQPPLSPSAFMPSSPSSLFAFSSPRWT